MNEMEEDLVLTEPFTGVEKVMGHLSSCQTEYGARHFGCRRTELRRQSDTRVHTSGPKSLDTIFECAITVQVDGG